MKAYSEHGFNDFVSQFNRTLSVGADHPKELEQDEAIKRIEAICVYFRDVASATKESAASRIKQTTAIAAK